MLPLLIYAENSHMKLPLKTVQTSHILLLKCHRKMLGFMLCFAGEISAFQLLQTTPDFDII